MAQISQKILDALMEQRAAEMSDAEWIDFEARTRPPRIPVETEEPIDGKQRAAPVLAQYVKGR